MLKSDIKRLFGFILAIAVFLSGQGYSFGQDGAPAAPAASKRHHHSPGHINRPKIPAAPAAEPAAPVSASAAPKPQPPKPNPPAGTPVQPTASVPQQASAPANQPPSAASPFAGVGDMSRKPIDITLDNMDIYPVLDLVLSQILGLNYVVDPVIKGTVSLHIQGSYTRDELLNLFDSALQIQGLGITKGGGGLYKVVRKADTARTGPVVTNKGELMANPGDVVQIFQLKYLSATAAAANLKNFLSQGAVMVPEPSTNSLLISDTAENIDKISKIISFIDTDIFKGYHWRLFTLENASVGDVYDDIEKLVQGKALYGRAGLDQSAFQMLPLKTINSILVVTKWEDVLAVIGSWIKEFDLKEADKGKQVYVYFVQNGKAKDIADTLNEVYGIKTASRSSLKSDKNKTVMVKREKTEKTTTSAASLKPEGVAGTGELAGEVDIVPDETNNALLIRARPRDYAVLSDIIKKIDVVPRQVLIEVMIIDVTLTNDIKYGVEWFLKNRGININGKTYTGDAALDQGTSLKENTPLGTGLSGFTYSLYNINGLRALITTLGTKTDVNILSTPTILAVDNQESKIEVGDDVPTLTSTTVTEGGTTTQSVQYRNAGIILKVKPSINDGGLVRMEVTQEVSSVTSESTAGIQSPRFRTRKATTYMVAKDGQTIIMGGLIQTQKTKNVNGIPFLKDIPILGYAFGSHENDVQKTELMFAITPYLIKDRQDADTLTQDFSSNIAELREALKHRPTGLGGSSGKTGAAGGRKTEEPERSGTQEKLENSKAPAGKDQAARSAKPEAETNDKINKKEGSGPEAPAK